MTPNSSQLILSVVIPTHNKPVDVVRCIKHIVEMKFSYGGFEIIVVDDGSNDPVCKMLDSIDTKGITFRCLRLTGKGPACARNAGIRVAHAPVVAFCDDDAIPQNGYLDAIYRPFVEGAEESNKQVIGVEGAVIPVDGDELGLLGASPSNTTGGVYLTCNIAFRKDVLVSIGGLDESFRYPAFEDCDLAAAAMEYGPIVWAPDAVVHHPRRRWSLKRALREIKFNEPLVLFGRRYGYLGWPDRPTRCPGLRIYWSAVIALPLGRVIVGIKKLLSGKSSNVLSYIAISAMQGAVATVMVIPAISRGYRSEKKRQKYI